MTLGLYLMMVYSVWRRRKVAHKSSFICTHGEPQWSHPGLGKWWPAQWRSGAPLAPRASRRPSEGHSAFARGHVQLQTTLRREREQTHRKKGLNMCCLQCVVYSGAWLSGQLFNTDHEQHYLFALTIDDLLPFGLLLAETGQGFRRGHVPPVRWVHLKLQETWLHLLQLWGGAGWGVARSFRTWNWSFETKEQKRWKELYILKND